MKNVFLFITLIIIIAIILLFYFRLSAKPIQPLGLVDGMLRQCPNKDNCLCSEYISDRDYYIEPIKIEQTSVVTVISNLKNTIKQMGGQIQADGENYIWATFTSNVFKFVDDLEVRIDVGENLIHLRSASRVGYSDFGVNKSRIKLLKERYQITLN